MQVQKYVSFCKAWQGFGKVSASQLATTCKAGNMMKYVLPVLFMSCLDSSLSSSLSLYILKRLMLFWIFLRDPIGGWAQSRSCCVLVQDAIDYDAAVPTNNVTAPINKIVLSQDSAHLSKNNICFAELLICQRKFRRHQLSCITTMYCRCRIHDVLLSPERPWLWCRLATLANSIPKLWFLLVPWSKVGWYTDIEDVQSYLYFNIF